MLTPDDQELIEAVVTAVINQSTVIEGGAGSGNHGHAGRAGLRGGSANGAVGERDFDLIQKAIQGKLGDSAKIQNRSGGIWEVVDSNSEENYYSIIKIQAGLGGAPVGTSDKLPWALFGEQSWNVISESSPIPCETLNYNPVRDSSSMLSISHQVSETLMLLSDTVSKLERMATVPVTVLESVAMQIQEIADWVTVLEGGAGSGNHGHRGRVGLRGGSGGAQIVPVSKASQVLNYNEVDSETFTNIVQPWIADNATDSHGNIDKDQAGEALYFFAKKTNISSSVEFPEKWNGWLDDAIQNLQDMNDGVIQPEESAPFDVVGVNQTLQANNVKKDSFMTTTLSDIQSSLQQLQQRIRVLNMTGAAAGEGMWESFSFDLVDAALRVLAEADPAFDVNSVDNVMAVAEFIVGVVAEGGAGSGNRGHMGRKGLRGGSASSGSGSVRGADGNIDSGGSYNRAGQIRWLMVPGNLL